MGGPKTREASPGALYYPEMGRTIKRHSREKGTSLSQRGNDRGVVVNSTQLREST